MRSTHLPKLAPNAVPSYRLHKQSGQAIVTLGGKDFLLGSHGTATSKAEYDRLIAEWIANGRRQLQSESTLIKAAKKAGISERTLRDWLKRHEFRDRYDLVRQELFDSAVKTLQCGCNVAALILMQVCADKSASAPAKVAAARSVLEITLRAKQILELEQRLARLEELAAAQDGGSPWDRVSGRMIECAWNPDFAVQSKPTASYPMNRFFGCSAAAPMTRRAHFWISFASWNCRRTRCTLARLVIRIRHWPGSKCDFLLARSQQSRESIFEIVITGVT